MPNRIVRDGFLDSEKIDALTAEAERLFHRMILVCDDAGRLDGRTTVLASKCFPLRRNYSAKMIAKWLSECITVGLVAAYQYDGNDYLQLTNWRNCGKAENSKYPWSDGSYKISYSSRHTRDGIKEIVTTSLRDSTPCPPHADGVLVNTNTYTETETKTKTEKIAGSPKPKRSVKPADTAWIDSLRPGCKEQGIDLDAELVRMKRWLVTPKGSRRKFTQQFVVNWLNRCDKSAGTIHSADNRNSRNQSAFDAAVKTIIEGCRARPPDERDDYLDSCWDKFKDVPRPNGLHPVQVVMESKQRRVNT